MNEVESNSESKDDAVLGPTYLNNSDMCPSARTPTAESSFSQSAKLWEWVTNIFLTLLHLA